MLSDVERISGPAIAVQCYFHPPSHTLTTPDEGDGFCTGVEHRGGTKRLNQSPDPTAPPPWGFCAAETGDYRLTLAVLHGDSSPAAATQTSLKHVPANAKQGQRHDILPSRRRGGRCRNPPGGTISSALTMY